MACGLSEHLTPRAREIATAARALLEEDGPEALSMRALGQRVGIRAPSIYKHFASKQALEGVLISLGFEEQVALFETALADSDEPLMAMSRAYREYALKCPQLYRLMYDRSLNRALLLGGVEDAAAQLAVRAAGGDQDLARAAWAFAHGMTTLELNGRFPEGADLDAAWRRGIRALEAAGRYGGPAPGSPSQ